jgi:hypothetical protein
MFTYLLVSSAQKRSITSNADTQNRSIILGDQLVGTNTFAQVPDSNHSKVVTTDQLALVGVNDNIVDGCAVDIVALQATGASIPDFHGSILGAGDHPFSLAVEGNTGDVACVTLKCDHRVGVGGLNIKQLHIVVARSREESLIRSDAKAIDLRIRVLNSTGANTGESFPEAVRNNVSGRSFSDCDLEIVKEALELLLSANLPDGMIIPRYKMRTD